MRIIYFDIDCLRPDHLGCYGYDRSTSPTIGRTAGYRSERYQTVCNGSAAFSSTANRSRCRLPIHLLSRRTRRQASFSLKS